MCVSVCVWTAVCCRLAGAGCSAVHVAAVAAWLWCGWENARFGAFSPSVAVWQATLLAAYFLKSEGALSSPDVEEIRAAAHEVWARKRAGL